MKPPFDPIEVETEQIARPAWQLWTLAITFGILFALAIYFSL